MGFKKISLDYNSVLKYSFLFALFLVFNCLEKGYVYPYSTAVFVASLANGCSVLITPLLFLLSFIVQGQPGLLGAAAIPAGLFIIIFCIYRKARATPKYELAAYAAVSMLGFILLGDTASNVLLEKRMLVSVFTSILTFICMVAGKAVTEKGLKFKLGFDEYAAVAVVTAVIGIGVCNICTPLIWRSFSVLILLLVCYLFKTGTGSLVSTVLGISLAIYYRELNYVALSLIWNLFTESLMRLSRYTAAIGILVGDYFAHVVFGVYGAYGIPELVSGLIGALIFCLIPTKILRNVKDKLYSFRERQLVRQTINRNRLMLSNRLYELSGVFTEMAQAMNSFKRGQLTEEKAKFIIEKQIISTVCKECANYSVCRKKEKSFIKSFGKMTDIGFAKGKLSLIDLPRDVSENCIRPNNVLYGMNKLLGDYRSYLIENANLVGGRELIASEAVGVAEILRGLALESGTLLKYQSRLERTLGENLFKCGFAVSELLIYGEEERLSVSMIIAMQEFSLVELQNAINKTLNLQMILKEKADVSEDKCYLSFGMAADFDAVFGVAKAKKDGSELSGDTHSVTRISGDKFLIALSDGMGSGEYAESISSASLSLIESFYKAGLSSPLILSTVNKLLSINTEDSFTALDVSVIDLKKCSADFIKYGSPYGFIVGDNGIRIVEGNSLPLGIIDDLKPSVCSAQLNDGDVVLLITDGISDAFGSSHEIIDYLRTVPAKNPQTLASGVLDKALQISGGERKDDMTALAVRIYKRVSA